MEEAGRVDFERNRDTLTRVNALEALTAPHPARLSVRDFLLLANAGAFSDYARAELIEGEIFVVNAQYRRHARFRGQLARAFAAVLEGRTDGLEVLDECSVTMGDVSMPEPDIVLTIEPIGDGPIPLSSARLIVEVSDTTLSHDLGRKQRLYASHAIPEYWIADLAGGRMLRMWAPEGDGYARRDEWALGARVESATIAGLGVETAGKL